MGKVDAITCRLTELPCQPHRELLTTHHTARGEGRKADPLKTISNISVLFILRGFTTNMPLTLTGGDGTLLSECEQVVDRRERETTQLPYYYNYYNYYNNYFYYY